MRRRPIENKSFFHFLFVKHVPRPMGSSSPSPLSESKATYLHVCIHV